MTQSGQTLPPVEPHDIAPQDVPADIPASVIYRLKDSPPFIESALVAAQHMLAIFVGIITPPLIICSALGLDLQVTSYIVSMSLFISGVSTFIQVRTFGPVGSGLLSVQGTSFTFLAPLIATGLAVKGAGGTGEDALRLIFGVCLVGAFIEIVVSRFIGVARKYITPLVTGTVVTLIGISLVQVGVISMAGGFSAKGTDGYASAENLLLSLSVFAVIVVLSMAKNRFLRMGSVVIGLVFGYGLAYARGHVDLSTLDGLERIVLPLPFRYGLDFSFAAFVPVAMIYLVTAIESIGDLTATSAVSGEPIKGALYIRRIRGGVLGDGINSVLSSVFNTFPNTTFSQNNGVIQLTGVASRKVGYFVAGLLAIFGLFPVVGGALKAMPEPVLGGATIIMFGSVAAAGIRILSSVNMTHRSAGILAVSFATGLGVTFEPAILDSLPAAVQSVFVSGPATGGIFALVMNAVLPADKPTS